MNSKHPSRQAPPSASSTSKETSTNQTSTNPASSKGSSQQHLCLQWRRRTNLSAHHRESLKRHLSRPISKRAWRHRTIRLSTDLSNRRIRHDPVDERHPKRRHTNTW